MSDKEEQTRRAEDSPIWKEYVDTQLSWSKAFEKLGASFTVRILLRRELFQEILDWLENDAQDEEESELGKVLLDCEVTLEALKAREVPEDRLAPLENIIKQVKAKAG